MDLKELINSSFGWAIIPVVIFFIANKIFGFKDKKINKEEVELLKEEASKKTKIRVKEGQLKIYDGKIKDSETKEETLKRVIEKEKKLREIDKGHFTNELKRKVREDKENAEDLEKKKITEKEALETMSSIGSEKSETLS